MVGKTPQNHRDSPEIPSPQPLKKRKQKIRIAITPEVFNLETWCGYHRNQLIEPLPLILLSEWYHHFWLHGNPKWPPNLRIVIVTPEVFNLATWYGYHWNRLNKPLQLTLLSEWYHHFWQFYWEKTVNLHTFFRCNNCNNNTWSIQLRNMMWLSLESADPDASVDALFRMISPFLAILLRKKF